MSRLHVEAKAPYSDLHLDLHTEGLRDDLGELTAIASAPDRAVRLDLRRRQAVEVLEWLANELQYGLVSKDLWSSVEQNLLLHYRDESHNAARCPACQRGH